MVPRPLQLEQTWKPNCGARLPFRTAAMKSRRRITSFVSCGLKDCSYREQRNSLVLADRSRRHATFRADTARWNHRWTHTHLAARTDPVGCPLSTPRVAQAVVGASPRATFTFSVSKSSNGRSRRRFKTQIGAQAAAIVQW